MSEIDILDNLLPAHDNHLKPMKIFRINLLIATDLEVNVIELSTQKYYY